ncbi:MAG: DEAD/DEAH box helicase family protein [Candidatus Krumholzibacteriia bacterium]
MLTRREELIAQIMDEEERLAALQSDIADRHARLKTLREELASLALEPGGFFASTPPPPRVDPPASNADKLILFRSLFRGREDVFPLRWENPKTGRYGFSPACANEWNNELCHKGKARSASRRTTCGNCPSKAFIPVTDEQIAGHLRGTHVMGVYPLLTDETCWFLATDFDGESWQEDVAAFVETCTAHGVPVAIERSRSGNGAHAWFFFVAPAPAAAARRMGCFLITETMARRHQLSMRSYDRLFPNQDTLPKGGFGNLIALPLQHEAREHGNTVFVDRSFEPYPDQWSFVASMGRIEPCFVQTMASEAARRGQVIGIRASDPADEDTRTPWERPPSGRLEFSYISGDLPREVHAVLSQRLFIEKAGLPSPLINQLKRLAAFQNPEFYKKQGMRLSTALTPRVISCANELADHIALPRGCLPEAESLLREYNVAFILEDKRENGTHLEFEFHGHLTPSQERAARALMEHEMGVLVAPPGSGKTVVGAYLIAARARNTLVLVHRKPLLDQWIAQLALFLGTNRREIGQIGAGKRKPNGRLDVAMIQSLVRKGRVDDLVAGYGHVITDECHHAPAVSFERVLAEAKARYVTGLTATPQRRDGHHPIIRMQLGPVRFVVDSRSQAVGCSFEHRLIVRETGFDSGALRSDAAIQEIYAALAADQRRNDMILDDVIGALEEKRSPILLTERRDHLEHLAERLRRCTRNLVVLHGRMKPKERREVMAQLASIPDGEERLLLATGRYIGEGFDDARLDTLFLVLPVSWKGTLVQYSGRLHRLHPGKTEVRIYDYVDRDVPMLYKMFERRLRGYQAIGYTREKAHQETGEIEG